ncbi:hypothetical protein [Coleofasciculus sp. E2-BRE-01]|uniref:hypothetical protein n=1 Tax=Coleofasciculus sp. E2-BRE-01 TaxID=3069524 RepID=UPI0032FEA4AD
MRSHSSSNPSPQPNTQSCHWRTQRSEVKNLSNVETHESEYKCDRTLPATRHLNPTPNLVIGEHSEAK